VSDTVQNSFSQEASTLPSDPHHEFEELCALSTTGELTIEEWTRFTQHLAQCHACRELKAQYEQVVVKAMPALAAETAPDPENEDAPGVWSIEEAERTLMESLRSEQTRPIADPSAEPRTLNWKQIRRLGATALILAACLFASFRVGVLLGRGSGAALTPAVSTTSNALPPLTPLATSTVPAPKKKVTSEDEQASKLQNQVRINQSEMARLNDQLSELQDELTKRSADLDRSLEEREDLRRELTLAQANSQSLEVRLKLAGDQPPNNSAQSLALKTQVNELNAALEEKDKQVAEERELLQHDQDIRNLIGARDLYVAEVFDVAKNGSTQKPFGRVFCTKDKSLVFYGYDLDQQRGVKEASTFQAWGRHGVDRQHDVSLGLFYQDDASQKRWVLKSNDSKTISQIDAVFVTVEPAGGSKKPSGKPLLFTYLRLDPNHP
jgi:TolA-binding protein